MACGCCKRVGTPHGSVPCWSKISLVLTSTIFTIYSIHFTRTYKVKVAQSCPTLCNPMDYTVHGILQARILEWVAILFSRGSSQPKDWTQVSHTAGGFLTSWATREAQNLQRWVLNDQRDRVSWIELFNGKDYVRNFYIAFRLSMVWHRAGT